MNEGKIFDMNISEPVSKSVSWYPIKQTMEYNNNNGHRNGESRFVLSFSAFHFETSRKGTSVVISQPLRGITIAGSDVSGSTRIEVDMKVFHEPPTLSILCSHFHRHSNLSVNCIAEQLPFNRMIMLARTLITR